MSVYSIYELPEHGPNSFSICVDSPLPVHIAHGEYGSELEECRKLVRLANNAEALAEALEALTQHVDENEGDTIFAVVQDARAALAAYREKGGGA